jgi:hypothetical protein
MTTATKPRNEGSTMNMLMPTAPTPDEAHRAIHEVIASLLGDARREGRIAREQIEILDGYVELYEKHLCSVLDDFVQRVAVLRKMYEDTANRAVVAQKAVFAAPLNPPEMPAELNLPPARNLPDSFKTLPSDDGE